MQVARQAHTAGRCARSSRIPTAPQHSSSSRCLQQLTLGQQAAQRQQPPQLLCRAISSDPEANQEFCLQMSAPAPGELEKDSDCECHQCGLDISTGTSLVRVACYIGDCSCSQHVWADANAPDSHCVRLAGWQCQPVCHSHTRSAPPQNFQGQTKRTLASSWH